jgi:hypothetical protein
VTIGDGVLIASVTVADCVTACELMVAETAMVPL